MNLDPPAADLLEVMAEVLEQLTSEVPEESRHKVRVAANLARILEREMRLGPELSARESELLADLLGRPGSPGELRVGLAERIAGHDDPRFESRAWAALVEVVSGELSVVKPGHDGWRRG